MNNGDIARFLAKVDTTAGAFECWEWLGTRLGNGYGQFCVEGRRRQATHIAFELGHGRALARGRQACHTCDNPPCVNPVHLFEGTPADNSRDMAAKGRAFRPIGELHPGAKLTTAQVATIRAMANGGTSQRQIAAAFSVDPSTVSRIVTGDNWAPV